MATSVDPDQIQHSAISGLGLHCLVRAVYPNIYVQYGKQGEMNTSDMDVNV